MNRHPKDHRLVVSVTEFRRRCVELARFVESGQAVLITRRGIPFAAFEPIPEQKQDSSKEMK